MALEAYRFRYQGAEFEVKIDLEDDGPTTEEAPNLHVLSGSWQTWYLDPGKSGGARPSLFRSVASGDSSAEHPAGNLSYADSDSNGYILCIDADGSKTGTPGLLYQRPYGSTAVWRMHK